MRYLVSALLSIVLLMQSSGSFANLDADLLASCKKWKTEGQSLESVITTIDNNDFSLNAGIPGLMFYGRVISPFLSGSDFLFGREFREDVYENHKDAMDFFIIATIPFVIFPYTLALTWISIHKHQKLSLPLIDSAFYDVLRREQFVPAAMLTHRRRNGSLVD